MGDLLVRYPSLAIKLGIQLSQAQQRDAMVAGLSLPAGQEGHLRSLPGCTTQLSETEAACTYAQLRDLHCHPPLRPGRPPSSITRVTDASNFNAYAHTNFRDHAEYHELIQEATRTAKRRGVLLARRRRVQSGVPNAGPPLTPNEEAEVDAPLPRVESGYIAMTIGGASWLKGMLQRWGRVGAERDGFNQEIDPPTRSSVSFQQSAANCLEGGLCCVVDVKDMSNTTRALFNHCQKCLPASLQSYITNQQELVGSLHDADRYWLDRWDSGETPELTSVRVKGANNEETSVEDEDEDDETLESSSSSGFSSSRAEIMDKEDDTSEDSLSSHLFDEVEVAGVPSRRANVIALMVLKPLLDTATEQVELLLQWILDLEMRGQTQRIQVVYDGIRYQPEWKFPCVGLDESLSHKVVKVTTYQLLCGAKDAALSDQSHTLCFQRVDGQPLTFALSPYLAANNPIMPLLKLYLTFGIGERNQGDEYLPGVVPAMRHQRPDDE